MHYDKITRWLHLFVALFIVAQLVTGQFMEGDEHEEHAPPAISLIETAHAHGGAHTAAVAPMAEEEHMVAEIHEVVGLAALAAILLRFLWGFVGGAEASLRRWFPWASAAGRNELVADIRREVPMWLKGRLPEPSESDSIAKSVHGVMMLCALIAAAAGFGMWMIGDHEHGLGHDIAEVHEAFANGVLVLVLGHVAMVVWHKLLHHRIAERILPWGKP